MYKEYWEGELILDQTSIGRILVLFLHNSMILDDVIIMLDVQKRIIGGKRIFCGYQKRQRSCL